MAPLRPASVSRRMRGGVGAAIAAMVLAAAGAPAWAQAPEPPRAEPKDASKTKTLRDEFKLFSYAEMGATFNLHGGSKGVPDSTSTGWTNPQRDYDIYQGYTFNMAELGIKRDPDEAFPFGMGLVMTAGMDAQKNHSIGIFRSEDDAFPFRNTPWFDIQEAHVTARIPIADGPVLKLGKFVSLLGYEVIESPLDLQYSRGYLFALATPQTATGALVTYSFADWLSVQAGLVLGWDRSNFANAGPSGTGEISVTPTKDLSTALNFIVGPEISGSRNPIRWLIDLTATYTGVGDLTLGFNFDYGWQANDAFLTAQGLGAEAAQWYGLAAFAAYDFTKDLRAAFRQEWFNDAEGTRTATPGGVTLFSTTGTLQYHIWKGLVSRGEFRHDQATEPVFGCRPATGCLKKSQDTLSVSMYYKFF